MGLSAEEVANSQILVGITNEAGVLKVVLTDGQIITWPAVLTDLPSGQYYLSLSRQSQIPSKAELAKLVLQEILQLE